MKELLSLDNPRVKRAPSHTLAEAQKREAQVLHIVWDKADGYPRHAWGFEQWSVRPYVQRQGCDGTTDENAHLIGLRFCEELGLPYADLYEQAYNRPCDDSPGQSWLRSMSEAAWAEIEAETIVPDLSAESLRASLDDLHDVNNHRFADLLEKKFAEAGYDMSFYWLTGEERDNAIREGY